MTIKTRLAKLERRRDAIPHNAPEVIPLYFDNGLVTGEHGGNGHPELIGKTEADIDRIYSGRDALVIKIVYASQDKIGE